MQAASNTSKARKAYYMCNRRCERGSGVAIGKRFNDRLLLCSKSICGKQLVKLVKLAY